MSERQDTPEQAEFREHCRRWLEENRPPPPPFRLPQSPVEGMGEEQRKWLCVWQKKVYDAGLIACDYPKAYGGGGHQGFQRIASAEIVRARVPFLINVIGLGMAAPTILHHGTEEQKRRYLPPLFAGDEIWCQGFSEPGSGSDLAGAQTFAERRGDQWVINGHKVWTSLAQFATWMILLARTSRDHKYDGLTYFVVPIAGAQGVTVRPLIKMTGESGFNEVLFEDLQVADAQRLDEVGKGWTVAMTTLLHERGAAESAGAGGGESHEDRIQALIELAKKTRRNGKSAWDDAVIRDRVLRLLVRVEAVKQLGRRARVESLNEHPMRLPLQSKLLTTEISQAIAEVALEIEGASSTLYLRDPNAPDGGRWPHAYMSSYGMTIAAGTSEIQRNILGERVLGLAKSK